MKDLGTIFFLIVTVPAFAQSADSSQYYFQKGMEEKTAKRWLVASKNFEHAISLNPRFTAAYMENGYANLAMRKTDVAKNNFTKVNEIEPANTDAIKELVDLFYSYHQYANAIDFAKKCTSCTNNEKTVALCYFQMEDYVNAEKILLKLIPKNPADAQMAYTLGKTYMEMELNANGSLVLSPLLNGKMDLQVNGISKLIAALVEADRRSSRGRLATAHELATRSLHPYSESELAGARRATRPARGGRASAR